MDNETRRLPSMASLIDGTADETTDAATGPRDDERETVSVPTLFFDDHYERGLVVTPSGQWERRADIVVKSGPRITTVRLTAAQREELLDDARHYASPDAGFDADLRGLCNSARATVRRLERDA